MTERTNATAQRLAEGLRTLLANRAAIEERLASEDMAALEARHHGETPERLLADAAARDMVDNGTREATLREELARRPAPTAEAVELLAALSDADARIAAVEALLEGEVRRLAAERAARLLARYGDRVREIVATAVDLACLNALATGSRAPALALSVPLLGAEALEAPEGFAVRGNALAGLPDALPDALAKRYRQLRVEITGT